MIRNTLLGLSILAAAGAAVAQEVKTPLYTVVDGYKVDENTMKGFRTWRQAACDRCHGANQEGMVGPSLINSLKTLTKEEFVKTVRDGFASFFFHPFWLEPQLGVPGYADFQSTIQGITNLGFTWTVPSKLN